MCQYVSTYVSMLTYLHLFTQVTKHQIRVDISTQLITRPRPGLLPLEPDIETVEEWSKSHPSC